jgi:Translation initiation factor IF-2, N-terminal region
MLLHMVSSGSLDAQLQQIAWSMASRMQLVHPAEPWDEYHDATVEERRAGCLALMRVYTRMIKVLQRRIDLAVKEALTLDATYGDIATACGISRQAARQRWLRRRERYEPPQVLLRGGPRDGERERPRPGEELIITLWEEGPTRPSGYARYVPSEENPGTYQFAGADTYNWDAAAAEPPRQGRPRVYEIAKEFGVESKAVLAKLQEMGEVVRSAASTVEPEALRQLWEHFEAPRIQAPPEGRP